jgi:hypothetical protein
MYKRLRIVVPAAQVLAFVAVPALKLAVHMRVLHVDYDPFRRVVLSVDYPIWTVFLALAVPLDRLLALWPRWLSGAVGAVLAALLLSGIALFWYLVVAEIEMRRQGKSMLRFSGWIKELLAVTVLLLFGAGAFTEAHRIGSIFFFGLPWHTLLSLPAAFPGEILGMLILSAWGVLFVALAIHDLISFLKGRARGTTSAGSSSAPGPGTGT